MRTQYNYNELIEYLEKVEDPEDVAKRLDDVCFNLARYRIGMQSDCSFGDVDDQLCCLKGLRDVLNSMQRLIPE